MRVFVGPFASILTYRTAGRDFLSYLRELCSLEPHHHVLDAGCGCGQVAVPLASFLAGRGSYIGFDVSARLVRWCERHIARRAPGFRFVHADLYNKRYNTGAAMAAADYSFPAAPASCDVVFAKSLFTHLLPTDAEHYLAETARVLRPGGRCLLTFFLIDEEARYAVGNGRTALAFHPYGAELWTTDLAVPESAVGYEEAVLCERLARHGLGIVEPIRRGSWCRREAHYRNSFQDLIVACRT